MLEVFDLNFVFWGFVFGDCGTRWFSMIAKLTERSQNIFPRDLLIISSPFETQLKRILFELKENSFSYFFCKHSEISFVNRMECDTASESCWKTTSSHTFIYSRFPFFTRFRIPEIILRRRFCRSYFNRFQKAENCFYS